MSNLWFNIRFGYYHWQWGPDGMNWTYNQYHKDHSHDPHWKWFEVYCIFGKFL